MAKSSLYWFSLTYQEENLKTIIQNMAFSDGSDSKEPACNEGALGWEDPLEEGMGTHSSIPVWRILVDTGAWQATVHGVAESDTTERLSTAQHSVVSKGMGHRYKPSRRTP